MYIAPPFYCFVHFCIATLFCTNLLRLLLCDFCCEFCGICIFNPPTQIAVAVTNTHATDYSFWCLYKYTS